MSVSELRVVSIDTLTLLGPNGAGPFIMFDGYVE